MQSWFWCFFFFIWSSLVNYVQFATGAELVNSSLHPQRDIVWNCSQVQLAWPPGSLWTAYEIACSHSGKTLLIWSVPNECTSKAAVWFGTVDKQIHSWSNPATFLKGKLCNTGSSAVGNCNNTLLLGPSQMFQKKNVQYKYSLRVCRIGIWFASSVKWAKLRFLQQF